ncbi:hypothetical protein D3C85_1630070 [compost metagenome]
MPNIHALHPWHRRAVLVFDAITVTQQQPALLEVRVIDQVDNVVPVHAAWNVRVNHPDTANLRFEFGGDRQLADLIDECSAKLR